VGEIVREGDTAYHFIHTHIYTHCNLRQVAKELDKLAKTPRNILQPLGYMYPNGATEKQIKSAFLRAGYGITKFKKWWDLYRAEGILEFDRRNEEGEAIYYSPWWH